jgi:hypothetical protein
VERVESGSMSKKHIEQTTTQTFWPELARRCVFCHDDIPSLLTRAHHHLKRVRSANRNERGIDDAYDLCWSCHHGLLHAGIIRSEEVREAAAATRAGTRKVTHDEVYRQIKADLKAGRRRVEWNFDDRTPEERSDAARRAHEHPNRRRRADRVTHPAQRSLE